MLAQSTNAWKCFCCGSAFVNKTEAEECCFDKENIAVLKRIEDKPIDSGEGEIDAFLKYIKEVEKNEKNI